MSVSPYGLTSCIRLTTATLYRASTPTRLLRPSLVAKQVLTRQYASSESEKHRSGNFHKNPNYHPLMMQVSVESELEKLGRKIDSLDAKRVEDKKEFNARFDKIDDKIDKLYKLSLSMPIVIIAGLASLLVLMDNRKQSPKD